MTILLLIALITVGGYFAGLALEEIWDRPHIAPTPLPLTHINAQPLRERHQ